MVVFGYKSKFSSILRALSAIAIGVVMIFSNDATAIVVKIIAAFLFAAGVVSFAYGFVNRKSGALSLMILNSLVDIGLGLVLFLFPEQVASFIVYVIGFVLVLLGLLQLFALSKIMNLVGSSFISLIVTIVCVGLGIFLIFSPFSMTVMSVVAGVSLIVYGLQELKSSWQMEKAKKEYNIRFEQENNPPQQGSSQTTDLDDVKDVEYRKED